MAEIVSKLGVVIVAAGSASRMQGIDKQELEVLGVPVVVRSIRAFDRCPQVEEIVVVTRAEKVEHLWELVRRFGLSKVSHVVAGGATRQQSVKNGVLALEKTSPLLAIHDGARPFVTGAVPHLRFSALRAAGKAGYRLPDSVGDRQQGESLLRQPHVSGDRGDIHPQAAQRTLRRGGFHARRDARLRHRRAVRTLLQTKVSGCFIRTSGGQLTAAYSFLICAVNESPAPTPSATSTCGVATYDMPSGVNTWLPTAPQVSITVRSPYFSSRSRHCACMPNIRLTTVNSSSFVFRILLRQSESWTTSDE